MVILIVKYSVPERTESSYLFCTKLDAGAALLCRQPLYTHNSSLHKQPWGLQLSLLRRGELHCVLWFCLQSLAEICWKGLNVL